MARSVSILELSPSLVAIKVEEIISILDKVGARPFVLYSINGGSRKGKSFMLNIFLQYLHNAGLPRPKQDWFKPESLESKFIWSGGSERVTEGINMWSEPFVTKDGAGREICILLIDTQGNFDDKTSTHHNALVFAFSALISSVMIWNEMRDISDDILQFFQCFLGFAKMASEGLDADTVDQREIGQSFQQLIFLLRDFTFVRDFAFGYHSDSTGVERNFKISRLNPNFGRADELNFMRSQILSSFKDVGIFALPNPGEDLALYDDISKLNPKFKEFTTQFVEMMFSPQFLSTKYVGGIEVTGIDFKVYVRRWAKQFLASDLPEIKNIMATNVEIQNTIAARNAAEYYETEMRKIISTNPEGLDDAVLLAGNEVLIIRAVNVFLKIRKLGDKETEIEYCDNLKTTLADKFAHYEQLNLINRKAAADRQLLLSEKKSLEDVISSNKTKLEQLSRENEAERRKCMQAIENAKKEFEAVQKELIAKNEAKLKHLSQENDAERRKCLQAIENAKKESEAVQKELIAKNKAKLKQLSRENETERTKCMEAIQHARQETNAIQQELIAKSEAKFEEINQQAGEDRRQLMQAIDDANNRNYELQQEMLKQQRAAEEEKQNLMKHRSIIHDAIQGCVLQ